MPGDAIRLRLGDIVPADARLLDGDEISVDQSGLTGKSFPATRKSATPCSPDRSFGGRDRRAGRCDGRQDLLRQNGGTGGNVGHCQPLPKSRAEDRQLPDFLALISVAVIVGLVIYRGGPNLTVLQFALVLTVAAIPVAMPTVLSVTMAVGARPWQRNRRS